MQPKKIIQLVILVAASAGAVVLLVNQPEPASTAEENKLKHYICNEDGHTFSMTIAEVAQLGDEGKFLACPQCDGYDVNDAMLCPHCNAYVRLGQNSSIPFSCSSCGESLH